MAKSASRRTFLPGTAAVWGELIQAKASAGFPRDAEAGQRQGFKAQIYSSLIQYLPDGEYRLVCGTVRSILLGGL